METRSFGDVHPGVEVGHGAEIEHGSVVKSGSIPPKGYISPNDIVEKAYAYEIPDSPYNVTVTQKYICVGCVCVLLDNFDLLQEDDVYSLGGKGAVNWYLKHKDELNTIAEKHINNRMP